MWLRPKMDLIGDYEEVGEYALTIDGYAYEEHRWPDSPNSNGFYEAYEAGRFKGASFEDLRYWLFYGQRTMRQHGDSPEELSHPFWECYRELGKAWDREWQDHLAEVVRPDSQKTSESP